MNRELEHEFIVEKVKELAAKGHSQRSIASTLHISLGSVNAHIQALRQQAKHNITKYIEQDLPLEYAHTLNGLNQILTQAWQSADTAEHPRDRFMNLTLAKECYAMKIELLSSASIVDRAVKFVEKHKSLANTTNNNTNSTLPRTYDDDENTKVPPPIDETIEQTNDTSTTE